MMGFSTPWAALFGLAVPVIILLWLLKRKRVDHRVSSTFLWEQVLKDPRANAPWQKLRRNLLMILQVAAATLLTFALLRPFLAGNLGDKVHVVLVVDTSGSMQALSDKGTRLDEAVARALEVVDQAGRNDRFTVVAAGSSPHVVAGNTIDKGQVRSALRSLRAGNGVANLSQAVSLAGSLAGGQGFQAILFSDAAAGLPAVDFPLEIVQVGRPIRNLTVERLSVEGGLALARVVNPSKAEAAYSLELFGLGAGESGAPSGSGTLVDARTGTVPAGKAVDVIFRNVPSRFRGFKAQLTGNKDDLAADDAAFAPNRPEARTRVLLVSRGNQFLEKALALRDGLQVVKATPGQYGPGDFSLYIFDGWLPDELPPGAIWAINPPAGGVIGDWVISGDKVEAVGALRAGGRPGDLLNHVMLDDVQVAKARTLSPPEWADIAVESNAGPLLVTGRPSGRPVAVMAFDLHESNLPLRLAFPVLVQNVVGWLSPSQAVVPNVIAGQPVSLQLDPVASEALVITPSGRTVKVAPPLPAPPWTQTDETGVYTLVQVKAGRREESLFAVNFPGTESSDEGQAIAARQSGNRQEILRRTNRELWPWFAGLAIGIISLEWWVFHRNR